MKLRTRSSAPNDSQRRKLMALYSRDNARRSLIDTVAYRAISQVATALGYVVLVRGMTEQDFGVFNLLYAFIPFVSTFASLGLDQTLRRYQPEYLRSGNTAAAAWLVRLVASARFGTNVILLSLMLLGWNYFAPFFKLAPYKAEFAVFCVLVLLYFQASILQLSLASHMLHRYSVGSMAALAVVKLVAYSLFAWKGSLTLERAILTDTIAYALAYVLLQLAYRRKSAAARSSPKFRPDSAERKRLLRYGLLNNFNDVGTLMLSPSADTFFVAAFLNPLSVGVYAFYTRLHEMLFNLLPGHLFDNVVQPMFFAMPPNEADHRAPRYFSLLVDMNLALWWPALTYAAGYHQEVVQVVFGGKFIEYSWLLPLVLLFGAQNVASSPATFVAQYEERAGIILLSKISAVFNVVALLVLVPLAGVYGAAIASGSSQLLKNLFIWWHVRHRARWLHGGLAFASALILWGGVLAAFYALKAWLHAPPLVHLVLGAVICGAAILVHLRSPAISPSDRALLGRLLSGKESRLLRVIGLLGSAPEKSSPALGDSGS